MAPRIVIYLYMYHIYLHYSLPVVHACIQELHGSLGVPIAYCGSRGYYESQTYK
jgi:hypothetical protein